MLTHCEIDNWSPFNWSGQPIGSTYVKHTQLFLGDIDKFVAHNKVSHKGRIVAVDLIYS